MNFNLKSFLIPALILFFVSFLLYVETIGFGYNGDDDLFIAENAITIAGLQRVNEIFSDDGVMNGWLEKEKTNIEEEGFRKRYRPIAQFSFALEVEAFGLKPQISHFINVLLFSLTVVLVFFILSFFKVQTVPWFKSFPFWAAFVFAVHPIHTEVVANIKSRDEIFALFFFLIAFLISIKGLKNKWLGLIVFVFYFIALLSKENAITFLSVVPLIYYFISKEKLNLKKHFHFVLPYLAAALVFGILSFAILKGNNQAWNKDVFSDYFYQLSFSEKYGTIFVSLGKYLQLLIFPLNLFCDYSAYQIPITKLTHILSVSAIIIHIGLLIWAIKNCTKKSVISFGILFYFISISVYSNLFFSTGSAVAERFLYIPSLGACIVLAYIISKSLNERENKYKEGLILVLSSFLLLYYAYKTVDRNKDWKDNNTLIQADAQKSNRCARLNNAYAELFFDGKKEQAQSKDSLLIARNYYLKAIEIYPFYLDALNTLATNYYYLNKFDSSAYYFYRSLLVKQEQIQVFKNITLTLDSLNASPTAIFYRKKLIELNPALPPLYYTLGADYKKLGKRDSAIFYFEKAIKLNPNFKKAQIELTDLKSAN